MTDTIDSEATAAAHAIADLAMAGGSTQRVAMCLARLVRIAQQIPSDTAGPGILDGDSTRPGLPTGESSSEGEHGRTAVAGGDLENRPENSTDLGKCNQPQILQPAPGLESDSANTDPFAGHSCPTSRRLASELERALAQNAELKTDRDRWALAYDEAVTELVVCQQAAKEAANEATEKAQAIPERIYVTRGEGCSKSTGERCPCRACERERQGIEQMAADCNGDPPTPIRMNDCTACNRSGWRSGKWTADRIVCSVCHGRN